MLLSQHAQVLDVADGVLQLGFTQPGPKDNFGTGGSQDVLADSLIQVIGVELRIQPVLTSGDEPTTAPRQRPSGAPVAQPAAPEPPPQAAPDPSPEPEVSVDDAVLDSAHNAEELLSATFGAEVIAVRDINEP